MNMSKKSIVFDLDDTICFPNHNAKDTHSKYALAEPNVRIIEHINYLHSIGFYVIINSARRMVTHKGDISKILADVGEVTVKWLEDHSVKFDELKFGKPYSSTYYVDDKAMNLDDFYKFMNDEEYV